MATYARIVNLMSLNERKVFLSVFCGSLGKDPIKINVKEVCKRNFCNTSAWNLLKRMLLCQDYIDVKHSFGCVIITVKNKKAIWEIRKLVLQES